MISIYVGNINFRTTEDDLRNLFEEFGPVDSVRIITDRNTGRSKGFAFVEMGEDEGAAAMDKLNDSEFQGRNIKVNEARKKEEGPRRNRY